MTKTIVATASHTGLVLAAHPTYDGFAWVLFEDPLRPVAWAITHARMGHEARLLASFRRLLQRYEPAIVVLEAFESGESRRCNRVRRICRRMMSEARVLGIETRIFDRETIRTAFARYGAMTRREIARVIAERITAFSHRLPPKQQHWSSYDSRQSLFDAAALAITYFRATGDLE